MRCPNRGEITLICMNIFILGTAYPMRGAMAQMNAILGWHLSKDHTVQIISFKRQYPSLFFPGKTQIDPGNPLFKIPTVPMIDSINPLTWFRTARYISERRPDVLIFRYWMPFFALCFGIIARTVKRRTNAKVLFICDNIVPHEKRPGDQALTKYVLRSADCYMVLSKSVEADLLSIIPNAHYVLTPLPLLNVFGELLPKKKAREKLGLKTERVMLFFGYIRAYKGLNVLLDAMPTILKKIPSTLLIVGEFYDNKEKYRAKIQQLGLATQVQLYSDYVPNEEIATFFSAADVVVLPYISATQSAIVPVAYHFNKPVIATDVGGLSEVIANGRTGFIVPPENPDALADAVERFYKENRENEFSVNIEKEKEQFGWGKFVERLELLLKNNV